MSNQLIKRNVSKELLKSGSIKEYDYLIESSDSTDERDNFNITQIDADNAKLIGLYKNRFNVWQFSGCVGAIWLDADKQIPLVVQPKIEHIDPVAMYLSLAENVELFVSYQSVFKCWPEEPAIDGVIFDDLTLLQITVFLRELSHFCQRELRQGFVRVRQNLTGKVKGKILVSDNLHLNTLHAREDRIVCQFQILSLNTPANRILKAALIRCYRYLGDQSNQHCLVLLQWARQCYAALSEVADEVITEADFRGIVYSGLMRKYRLPHQYARMILKRLRTDASGQISEKSWTVPYALDMNRLFEGYVGVLLSKTNINFKTQEQNMELQGNRLGIKFRPDYHSPDKGIVVDAKYKAIIEQNGRKEDLDENPDSLDLSDLNLPNNAKPSNADLYQVIAYCKLLDSTSEKKVSYKHALLAVPVVNTNKNNGKEYVWDKWLEKSPQLKLENDFAVYVLPCPVPVKPDKCYHTSEKP